MNFYLEVTSGPFSGKRIELKPGLMLRFGRREGSDVVFPNDKRMSGIHFAIECHEKECRIRDLQSRNGTNLNNERITEAVLKSGDNINAGETTFSVVGEHVVDSETGATPQERLLHLLRNDFQPLYAILDAARDIKILALLLQSKEQYQSLYEGEQGQKLAQFAPYLVRLPKESPLLAKIIDQGWGQSWGVYLTSDAEFAEVRRHLRHFLEVKMPDGKQVYFRFYDPRVLRVFLKTCTKEDLSTFLGVIKQYLVEGQEVSAVLRFGDAKDDAVAIQLSRGRA